MLGSSKRIYVCLKKAVILLWQDTGNLLKFKALSSLLDSLLVFTRLIKHSSTPSSLSLPGLLTHHRGSLFMWVCPWSPLAIRTEAASLTSALALLGLGMWD